MPQLPRALALVVLLLAVPVLTGCIGDDEDPGSPDQDPVGPDPGPQVPVPAEVTSLEHLTKLQAEQGFDATARGTVAYVAAPSGLYTVDISDPAAPERLGEVLEAGSRYVELLVQEDRLVAVASGAQQELLHFVDVTDPTAPRLLTSLDPERTVHNVAILPGTNLLYNPRGVGDAVDPGIDIIDASDPANPEVVERIAFPRQVGGHPVATAGCGSITFEPDRTRALCPAVTQTYLLDIGDPLAPTITGVISNPLINVHHWAQPVGQGDVILIADWAAASNAATCDRVADPLEAVGPPPGAVWAYDIADASNPQPLGFLDVPPPEGLAPNAPCSPHVIEPIEGQDTFVVGWHQAGVALIDASDPASLELLDQWVEGNDAWSVHVHGGLVLAGDRDAGLDVLRLAGAS